MSGKTSKRKVDRRVVRTRNALGDALVALMEEKPFAEITVQHVLDRAGVGRSTFYTHYRDKDDLFLSDAEEFFEFMSNLLTRQGEDSNRVAPVREFFTHLADVREFHAALVASEKIHEVMEMAQGYFARSIEKRLAEIARGKTPLPGNRFPVAHALAGALISLLGWWLSHDMSGTPEEMDAIFHQMVWSGVLGPDATTTSGFNPPRT